MSSGAAILRELQLRKRRQQLLVASQKGDDDCKDPSSMAIISNPIQLHSNTNACHSIITVCTGLNCGAGGMSSPAVNNNTNHTSTTGTNSGGCGLGTSAALIEIEELLTEHSYNHKTTNETYKVMSGGCTDHCTVGPNVFYRSVSNTEEKHFTRVDSVLKCAAIVEHATAAYGANDNTVSATDPNKAKFNILEKRSQGIRWKALRELVRAEVNVGQQQKYEISARVMVQAALEAELVSAGSDPVQQERAKRRYNRLLIKLNASHMSDDNGSVKKT